MYALFVICTICLIFLYLGIKKNKSMFIVVESGSTKADWMVIANENEQVFNTIGFNPYFHNEQDILKELNKSNDLHSIKEQVEELFFYGAGCSSPELNKIIENGLSAFFTNAVVHVNHDLDACAYACYSGSPAIACILGTGSNSCYFDGHEVSEVVPALGHILGDEASGSYFGKRILADYLYNRLPEIMHKELQASGLDKMTIVENVYQKPNANVYIASQMPVLIKHKDLDYCQRMINEGLQVFIDTHIKCYPNYLDCDVSFVGSLAYLLRDELKAACEKNNVSLKILLS